MEAMDNDNLVAEFILIRQQNLRINSFALLSALKLVDSEDSVKLKVPAVLLDISNSLIRGKINEEMLELLEILEKLLLQEHTVILSSLKSAYCWMAVECTCRFMWLETPSNGLFGDALERIWKKRIGMLKERESDLVTSELLKWESDLKKAFEDPEIYQKIRETNIRFKAISYLTQLLKEQWALVGCSSLELEARKWFLKCKDPPNASRKRGNDIDKTGDAVDNVNEELGFCEREGRDRSYRENVEEVGGVENSDWTEKMNEEEEEHELIHDKTADAFDNGNEEYGIGEREDRDRSNRENANDVEEVGGVENSDWTEKVSEEEEEHEPIHDKGDETVAQELKEFLLEIQRLVDHPTRQEQETNNVMNQSVDVTPQPNVANRTETGGEHESENIEETSSERVRPHLPTPEPLNIPLLRKGNAPRHRRPKKFWTPEEVDALREGVKVYGKAWKDIKNSNPVVLADRTEVDLKDKWRNLLGREK